jgi:hypothetical protein
VVASIPSAPLVGPDFQTAQTTLLRLLRQQKLTGDYATTIVRDTGSPRILFAFENAADSRLFAEAIQAQPTSLVGAWASAYAADLDGPVVASIASNLPAPRARARKPSGS